MFRQKGCESNTLAGERNSVDGPLQVHKLTHSTKQGSISLISRNVYIEIQTVEHLNRVAQG